MIAGQADAGQLELDDQHEHADEQEQPAHVGVGQDGDQRIDPAGPVDADRPAAQAVEPLELFVVVDDLAQPVGRGVLGPDGEHRPGLLAGLDHLVAARVGLES